MNCTAENNTAKKIFTVLVEMGSDIFPRIIHLQWSQNKVIVSFFCAAENKQRKWNLVSENTEHSHSYMCLWLLTYKYARLHLMRTDLVWVFL